MNMRQIIRIPFLLCMAALCVFLSAGCRYDPPEGYTSKHHTYEELVEFAKQIDPNAEVTNTPEVTNEDYREFIIYPAVINGYKCCVASHSRNIYDSDLGEFAKWFYRMDTDYDYYVILDVLKDHPRLGSIEKSDISMRFQVNDVISSTVSVSSMTEQEFEDLYKEFESMRKDLEKYSLRKSYWLQMKAGDSKYYFSDTTSEGKLKVYEKMAADGIIKISET